MNSFGKNISSRTINRVLLAHKIIWTKPKLRPMFNESIKKFRLNFEKKIYILQITLTIYTEDGSFTQRSSFFDMDFPCEEFYAEQWKGGNRRLSAFGA